MKKSRILSIIFIAITALVLVACNGGTKKLDKLPDLTGKSKTQINQIFKDTDVDYEFADLFVKGSTSIEFVSYANNLKAGESIPKDTKIIINMSIDYLSLPDLTGKNVQEMKDEFTALGVDVKDLTFRPSTDPNAPLNTFIKYEGFNPGDAHTFAKKLVVLYDMSPGLPILENLNKFEIQRALKESNITKFSFVYVDDNSKEYDSFAGYVDAKAGDKFDPNEIVEVKLYSNTDVNVGDSIVAEKQLFISKYIDSADYNQAIELYNPTDKDIDLKDYYIAILSNAKLRPDYTINLNATIKPNETFLIVKEGATDTNLLNEAGLVTNSLNFDGNDTIQLRRVSNDTYIDSIYEVGNIYSTLDNEVFIRREDVTAGNRMFKQTDWAGFIPSQTQLAGTHPITLEDDPEFVEITDHNFQEFGMTEVIYLRAADGDTLYFESKYKEKDSSIYDGDKRLRFVMVDTPETEKPGQVGMPYAQVATVFTRTVMEAANATGRIIIQSDRSAGLTETYGRHLGYIWYYLSSPVQINNITADGTPITLDTGWHLLNYELIKYGLGERGLTKTKEYYDSITPGNRYAYQWAQDAENYAKENKLGLFSGVDRD